MISLRRTVHRPLTLWDATRHNDEPYKAAVTYRVRDPFAVYLTIRDRKARRIHEVVFARELLIDGLIDVCGEPGFVQVAPHIEGTDYVTLLLPLDGVQREFFTSYADVESFLEDTFKLVYLGQELAPAARRLDRWLAGVTA